MRLLAGLIAVAAWAQPAAAQLGVRSPAVTLAGAPSARHAVLQGVVLDDQGQPLAGAVVSAFGSTTVFAVSDPDGRFSFRDIPYGPYLVRAHLQGYLPPRARLVQVDRSALTVAAIALTRRADGTDVPVLTAGVGGGVLQPSADDASEPHDHGEVAWRLRHLKRGVLKEAVTRAVVGADTENTFLADPLTSLGRAIGSPARLASIFADVPWNGHIDLLTSTSFDRPQDLLSMQTWAPRGIAFASLDVPTALGRWEMRGAVTEGELSSWILSASFQHAPATHRYEAGWSYGMQAALVGMVAARSVTTDAITRTVGSVYAYDDWAVTSRVTVNYGAKYARYDYLTDRGLFSPRVGVTVVPTSDKTFKVRAAISRRAVAPGAEEFIPPTTGLWLPPERTFSPISARRGFKPERLDHVEFAAEREWRGALVTGVRAFHQRVDDQLVTLFGHAPRGVSGRGVGHYYVGSAGDVDVSGWSVSVSRAMGPRLRASVDYTQLGSRWLGDSPDAAVLSRVALLPRLNERERFHDVTTSIDSRLPVTDTHLWLLYKVNSRFDAHDPASRVGARFDAQLTQAVPFLNFAGAEVEVLMAVRSLFREELLDASVYDEVLSVRPPKRVVGGVTVRF